MSMRRKWAAVTTALSLYAAVWITPGGAAAGSPAYELTASRTSLNIGQELRVTITGEQLVDLYGYDLELHYDTSRLEYIGMSTGITGGFSITPDPNVSPPRLIDEKLTQGDILFGFTKTGDASGQSGQATLGTVIFKAKSAGQATVTLGRVKVIPADSKAPAVTASPELEVRASVSGSGETDGDPTGGGDTGGGSSGGNAGQQPNAAALTEVEVKDGKASVRLPESASTAIVPFDKVSGHELEVQAGQLAMKVKPELLAALAARANDLKGATVEVKMVPVTGLAAPAPTAGAGAKIKIAGVVYDLQVTLRSADGQASDAGIVSGGIQLTFTYDASTVDESLLGVYYFNEATKAWAYVGGTLEPASGQMTVTLEHLSRYALLELDKTYADVPAEHWAYRTLKVLSARHVVNGVTETEFQPNGKTTRAEFAAMLVRSLELAPSAAPSPFTDIAASAWYASDVTAAYQAGIVQGVSLNEFAPDAPMTREQMAALLVRAYKQNGGQAPGAGGGGLLAFTDGSEVSRWAQAEVSEAIALGLMKGKGAMQFDPGADAVRAETAQAILNLLKK
ncbi:S-layer homology domain-containing protein [Paenibacillus validus]|uniref:S-layer homology domain-containing protein n=1 Tax=Paenibacillus validus TaxID=44253 RepID=UPI003D268DD7